MNSKINPTTLLSILFLVHSADAVMMSCTQRAGVKGKGPPAAETYRNPIEVPTGGREIADPSVYKFHNRYYLISTQEYPRDGEGFRVWASGNLVDWTLHRSVPIEGKLNTMMAPDLVYHEGTYYLYWSVFESPPGPKEVHFGAKYTPKGADVDPFGPEARYEIFSTDFLHAETPNIDGEIFFSRNDAYLFFCGHGGIQYKKLLSLEDSGDGPVRQLTACVIDGIDIKPGEPGGNGWTEAPAIFFEDGYFYLTYSGIHFLRPDYQIHSARGRSIETIAPHKSNPLIYHVEGEVNGMGNNNWITGPDLKTRYTTYHAKLGAGVFNPATQTGFMRKLMLDRYEVDPEKGIVTAAPTLTNEPVPTPVDWAADPASEPDDFIAGEGTGRELLAKRPSATDFVVEGYVKGGEGKTGITAAGGRIKFAVESSGRLHYWFEGKGWVETGIEQVNATVWHKLKIEKKGSRVRFFYDDRFIEQDTIQLGEGGQIGYFADDAEADFSWIGFSNY